MISDDDLRRIQKTIGYRFNDVELLQLALRHRSLGNRNNERLEFLGDSVLNFVIAEYLYRNCPNLKEGQLSRLRAGLVKGVTLSEIAREFDLGEYIQLGAGELKSGGFRRDSILADAVEALLGAIHLDAGFDECKQTILRWFESRLKSLPEGGVPKDSKTRLQEFLQSRQADLPDYQIEKVTGEAHNQTFFVTCTVSAYQLVTRAKGSNRRKAEQAAAKLALRQLGIDQ